eukprot:c7416_g1_i1 orf=253-2238(+)
MPVAERHIVKVEEAKEAQDGRPSVGPVYRNVLCKDGFPSPVAGVETCWDVFSESVKRCPNNQMLGHREFIDGKAGKFMWWTYKEVYEIAISIGSAMRTCGVNPKGRCGIYGANCPQWLITMEACNGQSIYCVPLYDTLGADAVEFIIGHAEVSIAFVQDAKLPSMIKCLPRCTEYLKTLVSFGNLSTKQRAEVESMGVVAYSWDEFHELGKRNPLEAVFPKSHDISTIMYTSGTTGVPKGVLLTHAGLLSVIAGIDLIFDPTDERVTENDIFFSYLPLAHIFDRIFEEYIVYKGASIGYWQGDVRLLLEDIGELKPTIFAGVPRVLERVYSGTMQKIAAGGSLRKRLFDFAYQYKLYNMMNGYKQDKASPFFDNLVFSKIKQGLGGHVRFIVSGGAPLAKHVEEFLRVTTCAIVMQGYGLTETAAASFLSLPNAMMMMGTVGPPIPCIEACLESVPDMNYDAINGTPQGEVCIRGKSVFVGYHKHDDLTRDVLFDGWFHTGDIGEWQDDGSLKIIDRKKNILKLSQGEYVAVESIENVYNQSPLVESIWVYGNSFESSLVAVIVPNKTDVEKWARDNGLEGDFTSLCNSSKVKGYVLGELDTIAKMKKLMRFEFIRAIYLDPQPFDMERDLLTPTYKKKRAQLFNYYKKIIETLYEELKRG